MNDFEKTIKGYLESQAKMEKGFAQKYNDKVDKLGGEEKAIETCCRYIYSEVRKLANNGVAAMTDAQVYGMAVHFFDEADVSVNDKGSAPQVVMTKETLTDEEMDAIRKEAREQAVRSAKAAIIAEEGKKAEAERKKAEKAEQKRREEEKRRREEQERLRKQYETEDLLFAWED